MAGPQYGQQATDKAGEHHAGPVDVGDEQGGADQGQAGQQGQAGEEDAGHGA